MFISRFQHRPTAFLSSTLSGFTGVVVDAADASLELTFRVRVTDLFSFVSSDGDVMVSLAAFRGMFCSGLAASADFQMNMTQVPVSSHLCTLFLISILIGQF